MGVEEKGVTAPMKDEDDYPSRGRAVFTLAVLVLAYIVSFVDRQILSLMVGPIKKDLLLSDFEISLLQGFAFAVFFCLLGIPLGRMADRHSRRLIIAAGVFFWSLMTVLCGFANSYATLFLARMGVGVGEAALAPAGYSLLADSFRRHRLVRATSIFTLGGMIGVSVALLAGGQIIDYINSNAAMPFGLEGMAAWQAAFVIVGIPGLFVALLVLMIREPTRKGVGQSVPFNTRQAFAYLWARRRDYQALYVAATLMAVLSYSGLTWFPTHIIRSFGLTPGETGLLLGAIHFFGPIAGVTLGTLLTERFAARGHGDASLRTIMLTAGIAGPSYVAPLMPTIELTAAMWFVSVIFQNAYYGNALASLQIITPNQLRATNSAMLTLVVSLGGLGMGTAVIGAMSDTLFAGDPRGVGKAMAIVGVTCGLLASVAAARGRSRFRETMRLQGEQA